MNIGIITLLIISQFANINCITLASVGRDLSEKVQDLINYLRVNLAKMGNKVKNYFFTPTDITTPGRLSNKDDISEQSKKSFIEFVINKETGVVDSEDSEPTDAEPVNTKSGPVVQLATSQLALWHGRIMESHTVETSDGYLLTLHRIPNTTSDIVNRTVLLHHGLLGSSTDWILLGPQKSLPYMLSDAGFDVWITNARGNYFSRGHISISDEFEEYWNFSWQEMGQYDLPAVIDYIRNAKKLNDSISFIGHSMGATALLVLLSTAPEYNEYLRMGILLAPLAYMSNIKGPLKMLSTVSEDIIKMMGDGEFLPNRKVPSWLANKYCKGPKNFCTNPLLFLSGFYETKRNASFIARLLYHVPAGGSINTILHYIQLAQSGKFHKYNDYTSEFSVCNISLPLALISSSDDWLATVPSILKLYFSIQNPIDHHIIREKNVSHTDFVWGTEATNLVFSKVLNYLEKGLSWNMMKMNEIE